LCRISNSDLSLGWCANTRETPAAICVEFRRVRIPNTNVFIYGHSKHRTQIG